MHVFGKDDHISSVVWNDLCVCLCVCVGVCVYVWEGRSSQEQNSTVGLA